MRSTVLGVYQTSPKRETPLPALLPPLTAVGGWVTSETTKLNVPLILTFSDTSSEAPMPKFTLLKLLVGENPSVFIKPTLAFILALSVPPDMLMEVFCVKPVLKKRGTLLYALYAYLAPTYSGKATFSAGLS